MAIQAVQELSLLTGRSNSKKFEFEENLTQSGQKGSKCQFSQSFKGQS
jgi:hypothetical protein